MKENQKVCSFSVIIPTYNRVHVLSRAIDSVLKQTYKDFELLIIDDGSTDKTEQCVAQYQDKRIKYFKEEINLGQNQALNTGLDLAKGDYISFLDSDDEWLPEMLEKVYYKFQAEDDLGCVYSLFGIKDTKGTIKTAFNFSLEGFIYQDALEQGYVTSPTTLSVKKECFDTVGKFELENRVCQDDVMCLKLAKKYKFGLIKEILAWTYTDAGGRLSEDAVQAAEDYYKLYTQFRDDIINFCGFKTMAKHYTHAGILFLGAGRRIKALNVLWKSMNYRMTLKGAAGILLCFLPIHFYRGMRNLKHGLLLNS